MRLLFTLLVIANLTLAVYGLLAVREPSPEAALLQRQVNAEQIRIVPPRPPAPRRMACMEWGAFGDTDLTLARREMASLGLSGSVSEARVPVVAGWWVFIPPLRDRLEVERKLSELEGLGVTEYYVIDGDGTLRNAISLGIFRSEDTAGEFLEELRAKGVRSAQVGAREHRVTQTVFLVREPDPRAAARLAELAIRFRGTELKAIDCPPG